MDLEDDVCLALYCSRAGCNHMFCGYCLEDCGKGRGAWQRSHRHVAGCAHNTAPGREVFASRADYEAAQRARRRRMLDAYFAKLTEAESRRARADCAAVLRGLGMEA